MLLQMKGWHFPKDSENDSLLESIFGRSTRKADKGIKSLNFNFSTKNSFEAFWHM